VLRRSVYARRIPPDSVVGASEQRRGRRSRVEQQPRGRKPEPARPPKRKPSKPIRRRRR
jgi:hypothetical protein